MDDCKKLVYLANLNIDYYKIAPIFAESLMSQVEYMSDPSCLQKMRYVEFLVFIARMAHEIYRGTK